MTHALRHGVVSWLIRDSFDPVRVAAPVRHTSAAFALTVYAREFEGDGRRRAADTLWRSPISAKSSARPDF
jgi:integrase